MLVHDLFEISLQKNPDSIAVLMGTSVLTYRELDILSNQMAHTLIRCGIVPGDIVGISLKRSPQLIASVIAVLKTGASYLPLDSEYPSERLNYMISHSKAKLVITQIELSNKLNIDPSRTIIFNQESLSRESINKPILDRALIDLTYIIYTSGSSGTPKGVAMGHTALVNLIEWQNKQTELKNKSITLQFTPLSFDVHFQEIFSTLSLGGQLVLISEEERLDPLSLLKLIAEKKINRLYLPFVALKNLSEVAVAFNLYPQTLKEVTTAGEQLKITDAIRSFFKKLNHTKLFNHYGPSETHVVTSLELAGDATFWPNLPSIGTPIDNTQVLILDSHLNEVSEGLEGEIYIQGKCLANGYINAEELTNERFINTTRFNRIYKTGDKGFIDSNRNIVFLGRLDSQVKIRGYRIETAEIEIAVEKYLKVDQCVVKVIVGEDEDEPYLCAYITGAIELKDFRSILNRELPDYMIPAFFIKVDTIPLTPSGKVDLKNLPHPTSKRPDLMAEFKATTSLNEKLIESVWVKHLKIHSIGINDNFFDLGGNSLMAIKILIDLNVLLPSDKQLTIVDLFSRSTIKDLASYIDHKQDDLDLFLNRHNANQFTQDSNKDIAVIAMNGRFPGANNIDELWENLLAGKNSVSQFNEAELNPLVSRLESKDQNYVFASGVYPEQVYFDHKFFGITPREAELMDPQQRKFLELSYETFELAGIIPENFNGPIGIFAGMGNSKYSRLVDQYPEKIQDVGEFNVMLGLEKDYIATRVAYKLNLKGPALSIHTGCSTSLVAIIEAVKSLRVGHCDMALAGGISISGAPNTGHLYQEGGILSKNNECRSFDQSATGTIFTDGAGVVLLKRLTDAIASGDNILAVIKGVGINNDGADKMSFTAPSVNGQAEAILRAQKDAQITSDAIGFIEGHGTATPLGDPIEVEALTKAFKKNSTGILNLESCVLSSVKSNLGHLTAAAGVTSFIKAVLSAKNGIIPGTAHFKNLNNHIQLSRTPFYITSNNSQFRSLEGKRRAGISSFGVGGTNAHVIIENYTNESSINSKSRSTPALFKLSAKTQAQLEIMQTNLLKFLAKTDESSWQSVSYTLDTGRKEYKFRSSIVLTEKIDLQKPFWKNNSGVSKASSQLHFMFPGQGSHYAEMGRGLYESSEVFKIHFDECCSIIKPFINANLKEIIFNVDSSEYLKNTIYSQPAIFIIEYSLCMTLMSLGFKPKALLGHSVGEFVAATIAGVFSLQDGLRLIASRAALMNSLPVGKMISVAETPTKLKELLIGKDIDLAVINGKRACVIAGPISSINTFKDELESLNIANIELETSHAFHSRMMLPAVEKFKKILNEINFSLPQMKIISSVTAKEETELFTSVDYWANQIIEPVEFSLAVNELNKLSDAILLEVGTKNILSNLAKKELSDTSIVLSSLGTKHSQEYFFFLRMIGELWHLGHDVSDKTLLFSEENRKKTIAPTYAFEKSKVWLEAISNKITKLDTITNTKDLEMNVDAKNFIEKKLIELFSRSSGIEIGTYDRQTTFLEMGMDSLFLTQVSLVLKKELKVAITFRQLLEDYCSLDLLSEYLLDKVELPKSEVKVVVKEITKEIPKEVMKEKVEIKTKAIHKDAISGSALEQLINRQLELMSQQLTLLSGNNVVSTVADEIQEIQNDKKCEIAKEIAPIISHGPRAELNNAKTAFGAQARITVEKTIKLSDEQLVKIKDFQNLYSEKTKSSKKFTQDNRKNHADPRAVTGFKPESKEVVYPIVVKKSHLQTLWDLDDNKYIDMTCGFGSNFFGNGNTTIKEHVLKQIEDGIELGPQHPLVDEVSRLINELTGNERTAFCNTGSEAVLGAMRIARTVTGREKIIVFSGSYHGISDEVILRGSTSGKSFPAAPGIHQAAVSNMIVLDYGTEESLKIIREMAHDVAAVLVEPIQSRRCDFMPIEFLKEVRKITLESQTCLIFDEIITGFRINLAGAQGFFGIKADICTYGKIIGGGMPIGVVSGKASFMDALDGGFWQYGDDSTPTVGVTYFAGTFVRHPLALAAALGSLKILKEGGEKRLAQLNDMAQRFANELNLFLLTENAPLQMNNCGSLMKPKWNNEVSNGDLLFVALRYNGVHVYDGFPWFANLAHTEEDMKNVLEAFKKSVFMMQDLGIFPKSADKKENTSINDIALNPSLFNKSGAPIAGARIGKDERGNPAWFIENPEKSGEYFLLDGQI